jgi:hypothetical protein
MVDDATAAAPIVPVRPIANIVAEHTPVETLTAMPNAKAVATPTTPARGSPSHNGTAENAVAPSRAGGNIAAAALRRVSRA